MRSAAHRGSDPACLALFLGTVNAGHGASSSRRSRHGAQHHVTLPTSNPNCSVNFDDAVVVIEIDGQQVVGNESSRFPKEQPLARGAAAIMDGVRGGVRAVKFCGPVRSWFVRAGGSGSDAADTQFE